MMEDGGDLTESKTDLKDSSNSLSKFYRGVTSVGSIAKSAADAAKRTSEMVGKAAVDAGSAASEKIRSLKISKEESPTGSGSHDESNPENSADESRRKLIDISRMTDAMKSTAAIMKSSASVAWQEVVGKVTLIHVFEGPSGAVDLASLLLEEIAAETGPEYD